MDGLKIKKIIFFSANKFYLKAFYKLVHRSVHVCCFLHVEYLFTVISFIVITLTSNGHQFPSLFFLI